jgi:osmotically-inducible protein OsmY
MLIPRPLSLVLLLPLFAGCAPLLVGGAVVGGAAVALDRRDAGALLGDQSQEILATDAIYLDPELGKRVHVRVTSFNDVVLLSGETPSAELRSRAEAVVRNRIQARSLINEIQVAPAADYDRRSRDAWITAQVKSRLFVDRGLPTHIKVVTSQGTVYLMGLVNGEEARATTERARAVDGVTRVVKVFEYLDGTPAVAAAPPPAVPAPAPATAESGAAPAAAEEDEVVVIPYVDDSISSAQ